MKHSLIYFYFTCKTVRTHSVTGYFAGIVQGEQDGIIEKYLQKRLSYILSDVFVVIVLV